MITSCKTGADICQINNTILTHLGTVLQIIHKNNYIIHSITFSIVLMDKNIAAYYDGDSTVNDGFFVVDDVADCSNTTGVSVLF
jgi:hypothetical protein